MKLKPKLSTSMTSTQFDNGYWYTTELKDFAERIGIPSASKLRKDEIEKAIKLFLETGKIKSPTRRAASLTRSMIFSSAHANLPTATSFCGAVPAGSFRR